MAVDTPAHIGIIGSGPIALECGLYARFLGYEVSFVYGKQICELIRAAPTTQLGNLGIENPKEGITSLGCQAILAQDRSLSVESILKGIQDSHTWVDTYLAPLSHTDLLRDCHQNRSEILKVSLVDESLEENESPTDGAGEPQDDEDEICTTVFKLDFVQNGETRSETLDVLIDAQSPEYDASCFDFTGQLNVETDDSGVLSSMAQWLASPVDQQKANEIERMYSSVDDFYRIGKPSFGIYEYRHQQGLAQVRDLFKIIGDREQLNLYSST